MRDDLRRAPVHRRVGRAARQDVRSEPRRAHLLGRQRDFELDAEPAALPVRRVVEIGQAARGRPSGRGGIALRNGASACGLTTHGLTLVRKFLARNGPSG